MQLVYYDKTWQAFTVLLNVKSVGVMGDNRTYDNTVCVRIVEATDGMTATFCTYSHDILETISRRIINEVDGINRVVYDISSNHQQLLSGNNQKPLFNN